jgi:flagellar biosynthesis protein FlhG
LADFHTLHDDQAGGLRRIMAGPQPRVVSLLSAGSGIDKSSMLINLAVSLQRQGSEVLVINADSRQTMPAYGAVSPSTLSAVALGHAVFKAAVRPSTHGFPVAQLMTVRQLRSGIGEAERQALNRLLAGLAQRYDVLLVDAELTAGDVLPLPILNEGEIVIQLNQHPDAIKQAYSRIKQMYGRLGCRDFGVLLTDMPEQEARRLFDRLSQVARRYLSVRLDHMGTIPPDTCISRASRLGRPLVDAFPKASASAAFMALAGRLGFGADAWAA